MDGLGVFPYFLETPIFPDISTFLLFFVEDSRVMYSLEPGTSARANYLQPLKGYDWKKWTPSNSHSMIS